MQTTSPHPGADAAPDYLLGIDGGGTTTRARLLDAAGTVLGQGRAGPSGLGQGLEQAWRHVLTAIGQAFAGAGLPLPAWSRCGLGLGLAGAVSPARCSQFLALDPGFACTVLATDADVALIGAHGGAPGLVLAAGTGSVAEVLTPAGQRLSVGGWGFPVGDEGSGAWLGLRAMRIAQCASDGRSPPGPLAEAVWRLVDRDRQALLEWCLRAGQSEYARLAPCVFDTAGADPAASALLDRAVAALDRMVDTLDPEQALPLVVTGGIAERLADRLSPALLARRVVQQGDACDGALALVRQRLAAASGQAA